MKFSVNRATSKVTVEMGIAEFLSIVEFMEDVRTSHHRWDYATAIFVEEARKFIAQVIGTGH